MHVSAFICEAPEKEKRRQAMKDLLVGNAPCSWGTLEHQDKSKQIPFNRMLDELIETAYTVLVAIRKRCFSAIGRQGLFGLV